MSADLLELFTFDAPPIEMFVRGTVIYWFVFALFRLAGRRSVGSMGVGDLIVIVLVADAAGNAMGGDAESLASGMVVVASIVFWSLVIDRVGFFFPRLGQWLENEKVCLVRDGVVQRRGMRAEYVTMDELLSELRQRGIERVEDVRRAYMEPSGRISVIPRAGSRVGLFR